MLHRTNAIVYSAVLAAILGYLLWQLFTIVAQMQSALRLRAL